MRTVLFALAAFIVCSTALAAKPAVIGTDEAYLSWQCTTQDVDGNTITTPITYNVARHIVGSNAAAWTAVKSGISVCEFLDTKIAKGNYEWNVRAVANGLTSDASNTVSKNVTGVPVKPQPPVNLTVEVAKLTAAIRSNLKAIDTTNGNDAKLTAKIRSQLVAIETLVAKAGK